MTSKSPIAVEKARAAGALELERLKFESSLILKAIDREDQELASDALRFFAQTGLIPSHADKILALEDKEIPALRKNIIGVKYNKLVLTYAYLNFSRHLSESITRKRIAQAFQEWADVSSLQFIENSPDEDPDLRISWETGDHGDGYPFGEDVNDLEFSTGHAFFPPPQGGIHAGELHFNDAVVWADDPGVPENYLLSTAIHFIGQLLGLTNFNDSNSVMFPAFTGLTNLSERDVHTVQALYGVPMASGRIGRQRAHFERARSG